MPFDESSATWEPEQAPPAPVTKFNPDEAAWLPEETGKFNPATAVLEREPMTAEQRDLMAEGIAEGVSAGSGAPAFVTKALLTKGGKPGDIAANVLFPMAGAVAGTFAGPGPGTVAGGMAGAAAGDILSQARQMLRGEREEFSAGELAASTAVGGILPGPVKASGSALAAAAKILGVRALQGAGLGSTHEAIKELIDDGSISVGQIVESALWGSAFGGAFGALEKAAPALWGKVRSQPPKKAIEILAAESAPEAVAARQEIEKNLSEGTSGDGPTPKRVTVPLVGEENPVADYTRYREIKSEMVRLTKAGKTFDDPEVKALFTEREQIKNRNSSSPGMPPETPSRPVPTKFQDLTTKLRETFEDDWIRAKKLVEEAGVTVTDDSNPYQRMRLMPGRVGDAIEGKNAFAEQFVGEAAVIAKEANAPTRTIGNEVNAYLQARHAPERNAQLGDGAAGMTDAQSADVLAQISTSPQGAKIKALADQVQDFHYQTLDVLLEGQLITPELYATLREKYPNHVPLNRILPDSEDIGPILGGRGLDVKSSGLKRALGSDLPVDDIVGNVLTNYEQAVMRAEKNRVDLATLKFAKDNPQLDLFEIVQRQPIGKSFDGEKVILAEMTDPQVLTMRENGKPVYLRIKDPKLAPVLRGINRETLPKWLSFVNGFTRLYSGLQTRFNPEFAIPNKLRDIQEAVVYMGAQPEIGAGGAIKTAAADAGSMKDVLAAMRGKDTPGARLYQQMKADGGTTGGMGLSTRARVREDMDTLWKRVDSTPRKAGNAALKLVDQWNGLFEDSTRLSIYKRALDAGVSRERAAFMAKEGTIDFNRMGTAGPIVNSLYMFSNASIQGSAKMLRSMQNPKVAAAVVTAVGGTVAIVNEWNNSIDPEWKNKISPWDRINSLPVMLPPKEGTTEIRYLSVPVSWGMKPIKVAADKAFDLMQGDATAGQALTSVAQAVVEGYNPAGGTDIMQAITPTILDVPLDLSRNKKWSGSRIKPDSDPNAPESTRYFAVEKKTALGRGLISTTRDLSKMSEGRIEISPADLHYTLSSLVGGAGRLTEKVANTGMALAKGEAPDSRDIPITSRFIREVPAERQTGRDPALDKALTEQSRGRFYEREQAQEFVDGLDKLTPEQRQAKLNTLTDEEYDRVERVTLNKAMPFEVARMKQLGVRNGARAIYLAERIEKMDQAKRAEYYQSLVEDGVITEEVEDQLGELLAAPAAK